MIEIRSPEDEALEKLPFYAALGVPEVWIFDCNIDGRSWPLAHRSLEEVGRSLIAPVQGARCRALPGRSAGKVAISGDAAFPALRSALFSLVIELAIPLISP